VDWLLSRFLLRLVVFDLQNGRLCTPFTRHEEGIFVSTRSHRYPMIEVFKTNVENREQAGRLIDQIQNVFADYQVNFDLEDCDRILRVKNPSGSVLIAGMIGLLKDQGFNAEPLPDLIRPASSKALPAIL
jgi:hypothetical protein